METIRRTVLLALFSLLCLHAPAAFADGERQNWEDAKPVDGVFFTFTGYMTTVLELKDGRFRYWFESDAKSDPEPDYPLTGTYSVANNVITLDHDQVFQKQWTCRASDGLVTLWRPDAMETPPAEPLDMKQLKSSGGGNILTLTHRPAEEVWKQRGAP